MRLASGTRLGRYEILDLIGKGGMGEVYRARDNQLQRDVAIKVSEERFSERFQREALTVAALNHPHICTLHDVGPNFLVMEHIDGRALKGPLTIDQALKYADQICAALDAAHTKHIIHRDLKPSNILVTKNGVKLLDFGLARIGSGEDASTLTSPGEVMGTPGYMAPEQWSGKPADGRTDIYAFGCVLYEMLTGNRLAENRKPVEPSQLECVLDRCLAQDPEERWQSARDLRHALESVGFGLSRASATQPRRISNLLLGVPAALMVMAAIVALWVHRHDPAAGRTINAIPPLTIGLGAAVATTDHPGPDVIFSPDGTRIVFVAQGSNGMSRLMTRPLDGQRPVELQGSDGGFAPFFSPDGQSVAFFTIGKLKKIRLDGGEPVALCEAPWGRGGSWGENGIIVVSLDSQGSLFQVPAEGGKLAPLTKLEPGEVSHRWPQFVEGGKKVVFTLNTSFANFDQASVCVLSLPDHKRTKVPTIAGMYPRYLPTGHLTYVSGGTLFAVPFDLDRCAVHGRPVALLEEVTDDSIYGFAQLDFSAARGMLLYRKGRTNRLRTIQWLETNGYPVQLQAEPGDYQFPRLSPKDNWLIWMVNRGASTDLVVFDWERGFRHRLTDGKSVYAYPVWSPDGQYFVFSSPEGIAWARPDESSLSKPQLLTTNQHDRYPAQNQFPASFTPNGKLLAFTELTGGAATIWTLPVTIEHGEPRAGRPELLLQTTVGQPFPSFSPDGHWLAYAGGGSDGHEVYVIAFPDKSSPKQISNGGGTMPTWSGTRQQLFYRTLDTETIMVVDYTTNGDGFKAEKPKVWSERRLANLGLTPNFSLAPDGKRFAALMENDRHEPTETESHFTLVPNFFEEVCRRVPPAR